MVVVVVGGGAVVAVVVGDGGTEVVVSTVVAGLVDGGTEVVVDASSSEPVHAAAMTSRINNSGAVRDLSALKSVISLPGERRSPSLYRNNRGLRQTDSAAALETR